MRLFSIVVVSFFAGCGSKSITVPDAAVPLDMHIAAPDTLAQTSTLTTCLAVDASFVYWSDATPSIQKVPIAGGAAQQVAAIGTKSACVAVDATGVYWVESGGDSDTVMKAPIAGGAPSPLASGQHLLKGAPLVAAAGAVYWITDVYGNVDAYNGKNAVVRVPTAGGPVEIVTGEVMGNPGGLAVDDTSVYYSDQSGTFARLLAMPASVVSFGQSALHGNAIALGAGHLAMNEISGIGMGDVAVFRTDGNGRTVVSQSLAQPLAVDDRGVYIDGGGRLVRLSLDGSGMTELAEQSPRAVALSADHVYFTDGTAIYALPK